MTVSKPAVTAVPIHPLLAERWSSRAFEDRALSANATAALLEAVRWSPSSRNEQPWRVVAVTRDDSTFAATLAALHPSNQVWAGQAPLLLAMVATTRIERDGAVNRHAWHDTGISTGHLLAQATALGLAAHVMGGFDAERLRAALEIPAGHEPVSVVAVGYRAPAETLPGELRDRELAPRSRRPLEAIAFRGRFGAAWVAATEVAAVPETAGAHRQSPKAGEPS